MTLTKIRQKADIAIKVNNLSQYAKFEIFFSIKRSILARDRKKRARHCPAYWWLGFGPGSTSPRNSREEQYRWTNSFLPAPAADNRRQKTKANAALTQSRALGRLPTERKLGQTKDQALFPNCAQLHYYCYPIARAVAACGHLSF